MVRCAQKATASCTCLPAPPPPSPRKPQQHLEIFIDQEVTADEVKVAQLALQLGFDGQEAVGHDLLHPFLWVGRGRGDRTSPVGLNYTLQA